VISHLLLDFPKLPPSKWITHQNSVIVSCLIDLNCVASESNLTVSNSHMEHGTTMIRPTHQIPWL